jgi:hypothetical protein
MTEFLSIETLITRILGPEHREMDGKATARLGTIAHLPPRAEYSSQRIRPDRHNFRRFFRVGKFPCPAGARNVSPEQPSPPRAAVGQNGDQLAPLLGLGIEPGAEIANRRGLFRHQSVTLCQ